MKNNKNNRQILGMIMVAVAVVGSAALNTFAANDPSVSNAKIYSTNPFDVEYSEGWISGADSGSVVPGSGFTTSGLSGVGDSLVNFYYSAHNIEKDENTYVDVYQGAHYNGEALDMRIYTWAKRNKDYEIRVSSGSVRVVNTDIDNANDIYQEYHFYKAGTLSGSAAEEVDFKGVIKINNIKDCGEEGWVLPKDDAVWITDPSNMKLKARATDPVTYIWCAEADSTDSIWTEVESLTTAPLQLVFNDGATLSNSAIVSPDLVNVTLNFPASENKEPITKDVVKYGSFDLSKIEATPQDENLVLDGWYSTADYETKLPETFMVESDTALYAKYVERTTPGENDNPGENNTPGEDTPPATDPSEQPSAPQDDTDSKTYCELHPSDASCNNSNQVVFEEDTDDVSVPYTSAYVAPSTTTYSAPVVSEVAVASPNTGRITNTEKGESKNNLIGILRIVLAAIGFAGIAQIVFARHHKMRF